MNEIKYNFLVFVYLNIDRTIEILMTIKEKNNSLRPYTIHLNLLCTSVVHRLTNMPYLYIRDATTLSCSSIYFEPQQSLAVCLRGHAASLVLRSAEGSCKEWKATVLLNIILRAILLLHLETLIVCTLKEFIFHFLNQVTYRTCSVVWLFPTFQHFLFLFAVLNKRFLFLVDIH